MIVDLIHGETRAECWIAATKKILADRYEEYNLILDISKPAQVDQKDAAITAGLDEMYGSNEYPTATVADTIFPASCYMQHGRPGFYDVYLREQERLYGHDDCVQRHPNVGWGTYFERMIQLRGADKQPIGDHPASNPLEQLLTRMGKELTRKGTTRATYELGVYRPELEGARRYAGPCLSHLSFKILDRATLHTNAFYRHHDYHVKAWGNLLGLARLQDFMATELGLETGHLIVHSTRAYIEAGIRPTRALLSTVN